MVVDNISCVRKLLCCFDFMGLMKLLLFLGKRYGNKLNVWNSWYQEFPDRVLFNSDVSEPGVMLRYHGFDSVCTSRKSDKWTGSFTRHIFTDMGNIDISDWYRKVYKIHSSSDSDLSISHRGADQ